MKTTGLIFKQERTYVSPDKLYDVSRNGFTVTDANMTYTKIASGLYVATLNGTSSKMTIGDTNFKMQSVVVWIYPDDNTTRSIADFDGGTHSIEMDGSGDLTATGWSTPTRYVNAVVANAVAQSAWNFIAVTTATPFEASSFVLGNEASWFDGNMVLAQVFGHTLTAGQVRAIYNEERPFFGV